MNTAVFRIHRPMHTGVQVATLGLALLLTACPPSATCTSSADCAADQVCVQQSCRRLCQDHADCSAGQVCWHGACLPEGLLDATTGDVAQVGDDRGGGNDRQGVTDRAGGTDRMVVEDRQVPDGGNDLASVDHSTPCTGVTCGGTCFPAGECCQGADCGAGSWSCNGAHQCTCGGVTCGDGSCRPEQSGSCCVAGDCGSGDWVCANNSCSCNSGVDCADGRCLPQGAGRCCVAGDCGSGDWSCDETSTCQCPRALCGDQFCPSESDCCTSADCSDVTWSCTSHSCVCPGGVGCNDGYCRPDEPGACCEPVDCGSGAAWSCPDHSCVCGGLQCNNHCVAGGTCCNTADCLDPTHTGAWLCGSDNLCHCGQQACSDGHCPDVGECCGAASCGDGSWQCLSHACSCPGQLCSGSCVSGTACCVAGDCGSGSWSCADGSCSCSGITCGSTCYGGDDCCNASECGSGGWSCNNGSCNCAGIVCGSACRSGNDCCNAGECGTGSWSCTDGSCGCPGRICGDVCNDGNECCTPGDCGSGGWSCLAGACSCVGGFVCAGVCVAGTTVCTTGLPGICAPGHLQCVADVVTCVGDEESEPEQCDSIDHDCDGSPDNGVHLDGAGACVANGSFGALTATTPLLPVAVDPSVAIHGTYIYVVGGHLGTTRLSNVVYRNSVTPAGSLGASWVPVSTTPSYRHAEVFVYVSTGDGKPYLFAVGGMYSATDTGQDETNLIERARINADGSLGTWSATTAPLPHRMRNFGHALRGDQLFIVCGYSPDGTQVFAEVQLAHIDPVTADITAFTDVAPANTLNAFDTEAIVLGDRLYMIGGDKWDQYEQLARSVPLAANGTPIGLWQDHPPIYGDHAIMGGKLLVRQEYMFLVAHQMVNQGGAGFRIGYIFSTRMQADGSLGAWSQVRSSSILQRGPGVVSYGGYVYFIGGAKWDRSEFDDEVYRAAF